MTKLRKGDVGKAVVLVVLIVAVLGFCVYRVTSSLRLNAPRRPQAQAAGQPAVGQVPPTTEMFAPLQPGIGDLLDRARVAPDPFKPRMALSASRVAPLPSRPVAAPAPAPEAPSRARPLPPLPGETERSTLELIGVVTGSQTLAVLMDGQKRYYVRIGDSLPNGWKVTAISATVVSLAKGRDHVELPLTAPQS